MPEIGESTTRRISVKVCIPCGCAIDDTGLCHYGCDLDGNIRPPGSWVVRVYERVDTLISESPST